MNKASKLIQNIALNVFNEVPDCSAGIHITLFKTFPIGLFLVSCFLFVYIHDPGRVSQDVSGSGCGPADGWFSSRGRPRRSPPYSLCGFCMRF